MLAPGPAIGRHDRFVGKHRLKLAVVVLDIILAKQRALAVERNGEAVGRVGAGIVEEDIMDAQDATVFSQRNLCLMDLTAFLGRRIEILLAILDPFDWAG